MTTPAPDGHTDSGRIEEVIEDLYAAVVHGDRPRFDSHLDPGITTWESHLPDLLRGVEELDAYREQRAAAGRQPSLASLAADDIVVDVHGDVAVARYRLIAHEVTGAIQRFRVTDVLRRAGAGWAIVHHHSERRDPTGASR